MVGRLRSEAEIEHTSRFSIRILSHEQQIDVATGDEEFASADEVVSFRSAAPRGTS
jgi:hypothetical protein